MNITKQRKKAQNKNMRSNIISYRIKMVWGMVGGWDRVIFGEKKPLCYGVPINIYGVEDPTYICPSNLSFIHVPD